MGTLKRSSFIAEAAREKKKLPTAFGGCFCCCYFPLLAILLIKDIYYSRSSSLLHHRHNGDEGRHPALPAAAAGAALARHQDPPLAKRPHPLRVDRQAHRAGEAGQVQPALAWIPAQEELAAEALRPAADRGGGCCPKQEELSRADGAAGIVDTLVLAQPAAAYVHHHGRELCVQLFIHG